MEENLSEDRRAEFRGCSIWLRDYEKCLDTKRQSVNDACVHCRRADSGCAGRAVHATDHKLLEDINEMAKIQLRNKAKEESDFGAVRDFHAAWDRERSSGEAGDCGRFGGYFFRTC